MKKFILIFFVCTAFLGCASKPRFKGKGDLCGLVIDENNAPVNDFVVYCHSGDANVQVIQPVKTNESGLFVFYGITSGEYFLSGNKNNYLRIEKTAYRFDDRSKIICLQTKSLRAAIMSVEELLCLGQISEARKVLKNICCEEKSKEKKLLKAFEFYVSDKDRERKAILLDLKKTSKKEIAFFKEYTAKLEEVIK